MNIGYFLRESPGLAVTGLMSLVLFISMGCQEAPTPTTAALVATATGAPTPTAPLPTPTPTVPPTPTTQPVPAMVTVTIGPGSKARYLVREQFAQQNLPDDAMGETSAVTGAVVFDAAGKVVPSQSKVTVNVQTLVSDDSDRDDFQRSDGLETDRFPQVELVVEAMLGLPWPLPREGEASFQLQCSMTAHGVTSPATWEVTARFSPGGLQGRAKTNFPFDKFGLKRPVAFFLLSVEDNIRLELDFVASVEVRN